MRAVRAAGAWLLAAAGAALTGWAWSTGSTSALQAAFLLLLAAGSLLPARRGPEPTVMPGQTELDTEREESS